MSKQAFNDKGPIPITSKSHFCDIHNVTVPFLLLADQNGKAWRGCPYCFAETMLGIETIRYEEFRKHIQFYICGISDAESEKMGGFSVVDLTKKGKEK